MPIEDFGWIHEYSPGTSGRTLLLLHGTGADERSLMPLAGQLSPDDAVLAVRGRSLEEGAPRFFRRFSAVEYDQDHLASEADALAAFVADATAAYELEPATVVALGFSNGANIGLATAVRNPGVLAGAVLLRPVMALEEPYPDVDLTGWPALVAHGLTDPFLPYAERVVPYLRALDAVVTEIRSPAGHELIRPDIQAARDWLQT